MPVNRWHLPGREESILTLLGLVEAVQECAENDAESIATLCHLFASGRARAGPLATTVLGRCADRGVGGGERRG